MEDLVYISKEQRIYPAVYREKLKDINREVNMLGSAFPKTDLR